MIDLTQGNLFNFFITLLLLTSAVFLRYLLMAGLFYYLVNFRFVDQMQNRKISFRPRRDGQVRQEIMYSFFTSVLFACLGTLVLYSWQQGGTALYLDFGQYHWSWLIISVVVVLIIHETYYYWLHRWMHRPGVYKWVHRIHHESLTTSAWTSFSFHPVESFLQALPIFMLIYFIPLHPVSLITVFLIMSVTSVINHLNHELYPAGTSSHWLGKWWIGATHHSLHHSQFNYNFGLYFTFWDHWMHTESPDFQKTFDSKTKSK